MKPCVLDKPAILTVLGERVNVLLERLTQKEFVLTVISNIRGILQDPEACLLVGFHRDRLAILQNSVRNCCRPNRRYIPMQGFLQGDMTDERMM